MIIDQFMIDKANLPVGTYYGKMHDDLASEYVGLLGGDGPLALSMIREWIRTPYASKLRWACVRLLGADVDVELKNTIQRMSDDFQDTIQLPENASKAIQEISALRSVPKFNRDVKEIISRYPELRDEATVYARRFIQDLQHANALHNKTYEMWRLSEGSVALNTARAIIALSRAVLSSKIRVYRGIRWKQANEIHELLKHQQSILVTTDIVTSFTDHILVAKNFASGHARRAVLDIEISREDVVACPEVFSALEYEREYIVTTPGFIDVGAHKIITTWT